MSYILQYTFIFPYIHIADIQLIVIDAIRTILHNSQTTDV